MDKIQSGNLYVYQDEISKKLQLEIDNACGIVIEGTTGDFKEEALASLLQIAPVMHGEVFGLTREGLIAATEKFDIGRGARAFAQSIVHDEVLFIQIMERLIEKGMVRVYTDSSESVYFPTRLYLENCHLVSKLPLSVLE
jgi:hypothetical protein